MGYILGIGPPVLDVRQYRDLLSPVRMVVTHSGGSGNQLSALDAVQLGKVNDEKELGRPWFCLSVVYSVIF